MTKQNQLQI